MFGIYRSRPAQRDAYRMKSEPWLWFKENGTWAYTMPDNSVVHFKAYQTPKAGDWIVYQSDDDIYHCSDDVFRQRNVVPEVDDE
jgi:hypothetical protein